MRKLYLLLVLSCIRIVAFGQATPTCSTTSTSWQSESSYSYGAATISVTGWSGSTLTDNTVQTSINTTTGYLDRTSTIAAVNLRQGDTYLLHVLTASSGSHMLNQAWIDFNDDGTFSSTEEVTPVQGWRPGWAINPMDTGLTIPISATPGFHRMRVRTIWEANATDLGYSPAHTDPCSISYPGITLQYYSGTCVDYKVNIISLGPWASTSPTSLSFPVTTISSYSPAQTFSLSAVYLTPGAGNLTLTPPSGFQVSVDGGTTWSSSATTLAYTGSASSASVQVRFAPTAVTSYSGNLAITGGGLAAAVNVALTGTGANLCSGTPTPGTATVSPTAGGITTVFTLNATGMSVSGGLTYQWQSSIDGGTTWTDITGATNYTYTFTGIGTPTQFKLNVSCASASTTATTNIVSAAWYSASSCTPAFYYASSTCSNGMGLGTAAYPLVITGAAGTSITDASGCNSPYTDNSSSTSLTAIFWPGFTYSVTLGANTPYAYQMSDQIWIDFNNDGSFSASESVGGSASWTSIQTSHTFTLPTTGVTAGQFRMRVISDYACCGAPGYPSFPNIPPCPTTAQYYGEVRDYKITIQIPSGCTAPTAQPTGLTFGTPGLYTMPMSFTAAPGTDNYLVVATTSSTPPTAPSDNTYYPVGSTALGGKVVYFGSSTSMTAAGLTPGTTYWFWVYSANAFCSPGPMYKTASPLNGSATTTNCALSGIKSVGPTGDYATLTAAMTALSTYGLAGPVALELQTTYDGSTETFPVVVPNLPCVSATNNVTIRPQGTMTVSASYGGQLISMNGARYVTIDGRVGSTGTTKALTIHNTNTGGTDLMFLNDAQYNKLKYVTFRGVSTATNNAVIVFSVSPTGTVGNSYNKIDNCDILDGATTPSIGIYSYGTNGMENKYDTVSNCNIANHFGTSTSAGLYLSSYNAYWSIDNNRFYHTNPYTNTSSSSRYEIYVGPGSVGNGFSVTNNVIGYASPTATGVYSITCGTTYTYIYPMYFSVGTGVPTSIQGNTIGGITSTSTGTYYGYMYTMYLSSGSFNVGDVSPNTIGSTTSANSIVMNQGSGSTPTWYGIYAFGSTGGIMNIKNNNIGGITTTASGTVGGSIYAMYVSTSANTTITGNTIGSTTVPNSIYASSTSTGSSQILYGIYASISSSALISPVISNNTVANLTNNSTYTSGAQTVGIYFPSSALMTISNNSIHDISGASGYATTSTVSVAGIMVSASTNATNITQNSIYAIKNTNSTTTNATQVAGIFYTGAVNGSITRNTIYDIRNASVGTTVTAPPVAAGIILYAPNTSLTIANNMISLGNSQTTNTSFTGIMNNSNSTYTLRAYYNSINIEGTATSGALNSTAFRRGNYSTTSYSAITVDVRNNIFVNNRTGGTGKHYAISNNGTTSSATGWAAGASNYNLLKTANTATVGYWSGDQTFASWKTTSASGANSYNSSVTFNNTATGDLHINMGTTANDVESHGIAISGFNTDYDNDVRPGPVGSVNGGGIAPDLGADEFDGRPNDNLPPTITYTALLGACDTLNRTVTATISDFSGVGTTTATRPRIYYKRTTDASWYSQPGTLTSGTNLSGTWSFTIVATDMAGLTAGQTVQYYIIAQDTLSQVGSIPSAGLVATDVNTVTTAPTSPNTYNVLVALSGTKTVGTGGDYATISAAATAYNGACLTGPTTFSLISPTYASETFPIQFNANPFANNTNTLTIQPAAGTAVNVNGPATTNSIFKFLNAAYITIDGLNTGGASLTLTSTYTSTFANIWLASTTSTGPGNKKIAIKNTNLVGGTNTVTNYGILAGVDNGTTPTTTAGMDNDSITIQGNTFTKFYYGIYAGGTAFGLSGGINDWTISGNTFGPAAYSLTDNLYYRGIWMNNAIRTNITNNVMRNIGTTYGSNIDAIYMNSNCDTVNISQNDINNVQSTYSYYSSPTAAIYFGTNVLNGTITRNTIHDIFCPASAGSYSGTGMFFNTSSNSSNLLIANNMISNIYGMNYYGYQYWPAGINIYNTTGGVKIYYNSINLSGTFPGYASGNTGSMCILNTSSGSNIDIRNNILSNTYHNTNNIGDKGYTIYSTVAATSYSNIDYNDYNVDGTNVLGFIGGSDKTSITQMQTGFGGNTHSQSVQPVFVAPTDLHLQVVAANVPFLGSAVTGTGVVIDYNNNGRSSTTPVQGCHEVVIPPCNTVTLTAGTPTPITNVFCNSGATSINGIGATGAVGITYQWKTSSDSTTWTNVAGATNGNYTPAGNITATTFYRLKIGCTITGMFDSATTKVTINPNPVAITGAGTVCVGSTTSLLDATYGGTWSSSTPTKGTIDPTFGVVTGVSPGATVISYVLPTTCQTTYTVNVVPPPAVPLITSTPAQVCNNSIATIGITPILPVNILNGWEVGVPVTPGTLVGGWNTNAGSTGYITQISSGSYPSATAHTGTYFADFHSYSYSGVQAALISPSFDLTNRSTPKISFWVWRDGASYNTSSYTSEGWQIWMNTTASMTGATQLGFVPRCMTCTTPSANVTGTATPSTSGWYQYSVDIPASFSGATNYVLFNGVSQYGDDCYLDDVAITAGAPAPPTWASTTDLYKNSTATLPYVAGDTTNTVYFKPTTFTATTPVTYTATASNGACATSGNITVTVNPQPAVITGTHNVCFGLAGTLADATPGGTWTSSNATVASVGSSTGIVSGITAGTSTITYTLTSTGCTKRHQVTINALPADITGTASACVGATTALADATAGGTWSSGTTAIAGVDATSGVVSGVSAGLAIVTYTSAVGCIKTIESTINPLPSTTITPATVATVCQGDAAPFTANAPSPSFSILFQDFNAGLGTWTVTSPSGDPASNWLVKTTTASGITGDGTAMLESDAEYVTPTETILTSPSFSTIGYGSANVSFNQYLLSMSSSDALVDVEYSIDNSTWNTVNSQVGVLSGSGSWSSTSTPEVTASLPAGALGQPSVKLRWHYSSNFGLYWDIDNIRVTAFQPPVTYAWSGVGGAAGLSCAACGTTTITPTAVGANVYSVVSTTSAGCQSTNGVTVNVNPLPSAITGTMQVCVNSTVTMSDVDAGGTWGSADATVSVDPAAGIVTGISAGTATVTYTLPTGCRNSTVITVNPLPSASTGTMQVCEGLTTTLTNSTGGGSWSSSFPVVASVDAAGVVTGNVAGSADIYYTLTATGCQIAANVTVNPTPQPIGGSLQVCEGSTSTLTDTDPSGTWTSSVTSVATIDATSGALSGLVAGATTITYQLPTGCINTAIVTVNAVPAAITGTKVVCQGLTTTLGNATTGGTWSTASADASVDAAGVVTGINAAVATITYQLATSCVSTANVTVNPTPATIGGTPQVCIGLTTALSDADAGGTWASGSTGIATVDATTGVVTGVVGGTSTITYRLPTGCINTVNVSVNPTASAITGIRKVCEGMTTTLANADPGGAWSSSMTAVASVDASGIVTGNGSGVTTITYTLPTGCTNTADVTVNPVPSAIAGANQVCEGLNTALFNSTSGGSWSSTNPTAAGVDATGTVSGYTAGNTTISYTLSGTGCVSTLDMTVNPTPGAITGTRQVCEAGTTNLGDPTTGGAWSTGSLSASVNASGVVSGISAGVAPITYMLATGCKTVANVTVNPLPATITGSATVCEGANTNLYNTSAGGAWTSGALGTATVASTSGVVSGIAAGNAPITYTLPTGCKTSTNVTVNPVPAAITGTQIVCAGQTTGLSNPTSGGTWSSSLPLVASVDATTGVVTGANMGNTTIAYILPTTCKATAVVTVNPLPAPIAGSAQVCAGSIGTLTDGSASGTWSSSMPVVATISSTGSVNAIASGTTLITYTLPTGCIRTRLLTVNPVPAAITGTMQLCQSATTALDNTTAGGVWSSSSITVATISSTGVVSGGLTGTSTITYMLPTGCKATDVVTVNQLPSAIAGTPNVCEGATTALSNTVSGGSWSSANGTIATVDGTTGVMTGVLAGSTTISYQLPTGCMATRNVVINPQPAAISGASQVCQGSTTGMINTVSGGIWSSSNTAVASAGLMTGTVTGLAAGSANISYTLMTGCAVSTTIVVDALPGVIAGSLNVCNGQATALSSTGTGGTWSSSNPAIADISTTGTVSGMTSGNAIVTYTLPTGCKRTSVVTVNALPTVYNVSGGGTYCAGGTGVHIGVDGSNNGVNYQLYSGTTPVGSAVTGTSGLPVDFGTITAAGTYSVVARNASTGCASDMTGTKDVAVSTVVTPSVTVTTASDVVCAGTLTSYTASAVNGGTAPTYQWLVNGSTIVGATSAAYSYTPGNGDVVSNVMTSNNACASVPTASAARTMTVNANMMPVVNAIATSGISLCEGNTATFTVSTLYGGTAPTYTWMNGSSIIGTGSTFAYVPTNGDNITVKMNSNYMCRLADSVTSPAVILTTNPIYVPALEIASNYGFFVNENTNVTLSASVATAGPAPAYQWYLKSAAITGATNSAYTQVFHDGDSVTCQVTGSGVCGMSTFNSVIMHVGPTSVAGTTIGNADVRLMPNPNKGEFTVRGTLSVKTDKEVALEVTNVLGQVVYKTIVTARNGEIDARIKLDNTLANGMYMLNMIAGEDRKVFHFVLEQ